ncbi:MAG: sugar transferase [Hyphomicrobium sp.]
MRRSLFLLLDIALCIFAVIAAQVLRDNLEFIPHRIVAIAPYVGFTAVAAALALPALGVTRPVWRYTSLIDCLFIAIASLVVVLAAVLLGFNYNRLDGVARSLPILQFFLTLCMLLGLRVVARAAERWRRRERLPQFAEVSKTPAYESVLVVGLNSLTELYLRSAREVGDCPLRIAGVLGLRARHAGRRIAGYSVVGTIETLPTVLSDLSTRGIKVSRLVVTVAPSDVAADARQILEDLARPGDVAVEYLAHTLGFAGTELRNRHHRWPSSSGASDAASSLALSGEQLEAVSRRPYWSVKRGIDVAMSSVAIVLLLPVMVIVAAVLAYDLGFPVVFWQERPGLGGRPFRVLKFRTMRSQLNPDGTLLSETERISAIGRGIRRLRLDELPQLFNILLGQMSFVGPRPLLPVDQPEVGSARLLVRPGLTGWAQVLGGRNVSPIDKSAMDLWYVHNASLLVDLEIVLRTIPVLVTGERVNKRAIERAWDYLHGSSVARPQAPPPRATTLALVNEKLRRQSAA